MSIKTKRSELTKNQQAQLSLAAIGYADRLAGKEPQLSHRWYREGYTDRLIEELNTNLAKLAS